MKRSQILLDFSNADLGNNLDIDIRNSASAVTTTENYIWVGNRNNTSLQRLQKLDVETYGNCKTYHLPDFLDLPSKPNISEIKSLHFDGRYLWIVGSHSYKRESTDANAEDQQEEIKRLGKITIRPFSCLLARIPCVKNENGEYELRKECADPTNLRKSIWAGKLQHKRWHNQLSKLLRKDKHLGKFIKIPSNENGLNIEGISNIGNKVYLGLRGPVLSNLAVILQIKVKNKKQNKGQLELKNLKSGTEYQKLFMDLGGLGIRDLTSSGKTISLLAGATMDVDCTSVIYTWQKEAKYQADQLIAKDKITRLLEIPYGSKSPSVNRPAALASLDNDSILVLIENPGQNRLKGGFGVKADYFGSTGQE